MLTTLLLWNQLEARLYAQVALDIRMINLLPNVQGRSSNYLHREEIWRRDIMSEHALPFFITFSVFPSIAPSREGIRYFKISESCRRAPQLLERKEIRNDCLRKDLGATAHQGRVGIARANALPRGGEKVRERRAPNSNDLVESDLRDVTRREKLRASSVTHASSIKRR